jgi:epoxyqueuosine reductase
VLESKVDLKAWIRGAAARLGFDLCGIAPAALPDADRLQYLWWLEEGFHGEMKYMERREHEDIRQLLPGVRSVICAGMVYNTSHPLSTECPDLGRGWISRYAWGEDYHFVLEERLQKLLEELRAAVGSPFEARIYVDTGPVLERALARAAGLGWIAKNTCLIHPKAGSWFLVGEILTSLELEPDEPVPDYCGTCTRCIDACPTGAIVEPYVLDATRCISYFTIELKGAIPEEFRAGMGSHVFGCDICQDVCPWNRKATATLLPVFQPRPLAFPSRPALRDEQAATAETNHNRDSNEAVQDAPPADAAATTFNPPLELLASLTEDEFRESFHRSPVKRAKYRGLLRNVAVAMGNSGLVKFRPVLEKLAQHPDPVVQEHAAWALERLEEARPAGRQAK